MISTTPVIFIANPNSPSGFDKVEIDIAKDKLIRKYFIVLESLYYHFNWSTKERPLSCERFEFSTDKISLMTAEKMSSESTDIGECLSFSVIVQLQLDKNNFAENILLTTLTKNEDEIVYSPPTTVSTGLHASHIIAICNEYFEEERQKIYEHCR